MRVLFTFLIVLLFSDNLVSQACNTPWNAGTVYSTPTSVSHNGRNYTSKWWTQNEQPGIAGVWTDNGPCSNCTLLPGSIGSAQAIPSNSIPSPLTNISSATVSGGGTIAYQWQKSSNNSTWTDITGATAAGYSPGIQTSKTYYRRKVTASGCSDAFTSSVLINIAVNTNVDTDGDGVLDNVDLDDDNDGILDCVENGFNQINLSNIFNVAGNANYTSGNEIQLTPDLNSQAGSAMSFGKIDFNNDFNFNVEVYLGANDGGADGMAIVFHNDPNGINAVGFFGSGLGVSGIKNGIAIEFDTWDNGEVPEDHTQIKLTSNFSDLNTLTKLPNIEDSKWHLVNFSWNAGTQTLSYSIDGNVIANYANDLVSNVFNNEASVYLGFTAGTGGAKNEQKIRFPDSFCSYPMYLDTDGDGIVNSLDLDSDGDGCADAIEGGAAFTTSNLSNDKLTGAVDTKGVPVAATASGQTVGASADANLKDAECPKCSKDTDKDEVCDAVDLDDDNDGILDVKECMTSNFYWSTPPTINGKTATGKINTVNYTYTSTVNIQTTPTIYSYGTFPSSFNIPNTTVIRNDFISTNTIKFSQPVLNPTLVFSSIGNGGQNVPIKFSNPVEVLFQSGGVTVNSSTQISGQEGYVVLRMNGTYSQISFDYLADEGYVNFSFGADFATFCDTDNDGIPNYLDTDSDGDGCADAIEGGASFKTSDLTTDALSGAVDANGVPVVAGASGQTVGSSADAAVQDKDCGCKNDNDKDGVCDIDDLDDDNDGILDVVECEDESASWDFETPVVGAGNNNQGTTFQGWTCTGGGWINLIHPPYGGAVPQTASSGNQYVEVGGTGDFSRSYTVASAGVVTVEIDFACWGGVSEQTQINIFKADGTTLVAQSAVITTPPPANWNNAWQHKGSVSAYLEPGNYIIKFFLGNFQAFDNVKISSATVANCDTDNDGIINSFDTDSDGDGCADAIEGGASFKKGDLTNDALTGAVDANGVPVVAGASGQTLGSSANAAVQDVDCACTKPSPPVVEGSASAPIHSFNFSATQALNETTPVFTNGKKYQYKVTGTWSVWSNDPSKNALDAAFRYADNSTGAPLGSPYANTYIKLNGSNHPRPDTNVYKANHEYWYSFTGTGAALNFTFSDSPYTDNNGSLKYTFYGMADTIKVCANNSTKDLSDYVSGTNLLWYTSATGSTGSATSPQVNNAVEAVHSYWVTQTVNGCESDREQLIYEVLAKPNVNLGNDTVLCDGENMVISAPNAKSYVWNTAETTQSITVSSAGNYSVEVTNANGCKASDAIIVDVKSCSMVYIEEDTLEICKGDSVEIHAKNVTNQVWSGTDAFRIINDSTIKVSPGANSASYKIGKQSSYIRGTNVIVNGDFEQGATGFTSQYVQTVYSQGGYMIGTNPQSYNGVFSACGDHTSGAGKMFITDAATVANVKIWCQTISTLANTKYEFAAWVTSVYAPNPPILQFSVNGSALGNAFNVGATTCDWQEFAATWNSGTTTSAEICLINQNTAGSGNDFAIDDITFSPVIPTASGGDSVIVIVNDAPSIDLGTNKNICAGDSVVLDAGVAISYEWNNGESTRKIVVNSSGDYSVAITGANGCKSLDTVNVKVNAKPILTLNNASICDGDAAVTFDAGAGYSTYSWSENGTGNNQTTSGKTTGNYTVNVIDANGCKDTATAVLTVNAKPNVVLTNIVICEGDAAVTFDAGTGYSSYTWSENGTGNNQSTNGKIAGNYTVHVVDANGCKDTATAVLTVNAKPNVVLTNAAICKGDAAVVFDAGAGYSTYEWTENGSGNSQTFSANEAGNYTVKVVDAKGCIDTATAILTVNAKPNVALSNAVICEGDAAVTFDAGAGYSTYEWTENGSGNSQTFNAKHTGKYTVKVVDAKGCKDTATALLTVNVKPIVVLNNATICEGDAAVTFDAGAGYSTYSWSENGTGNNQTTNGKTTGNYTVNVIDANGCKDTATAVLTVNVKPNVVLTNTVICEGDAAVTFDAGTGYSSYAWSENGTGNNQSTNGEIAGNYTVNVVDANGCKDTATAILTVHAKPNVVLTNAVICEGDAAVTFDAGAGYSSYVWSDKGTGNNQTVSGTAAGNYTVKVADTNGCKDTATAILKVNKKPTVHFAAMLPICKDFPSFPLKGATPIGGIYEVEHGSHWQRDSVFNVSASTNGNYNIRYTYTDSNTCTNTASVSLVVNDLPKLKIDDQVICEGESAIFDAGSNFKKYAWSNGSNLSKISTSEDGVYTITVTDFNGCRTKDTMVLKVNSLPVVKLGDNQKICDGEIVTLQSSIDNANYLWSDGSTNKTLEVKTSGKYSLSVTDSNSCVGKDEVDITVVPLPKVDLGIDKEICEGDVATLSISDSKASYYWSNGAKEPTISVSSSLALILTQYYDALCPVRDTINFIVIQYPISQLGNDTTICFSESLNGSLKLDAGVLAESYLWSDGSTYPSISVDKKGTYSVSLTNGKSCTIHDEIVLDELCKTSLFCPNAFTPNNDGNNDVFLVRGLNAEYFHLMIFNRWGDLIFESYDINKGWDGTLMGNKVQQDVYVVKIVYSVNETNDYQKKEQIISSLTLIR